MSATLRKNRIVFLFLAMLTLVLILPANAQVYPNARDRRKLHAQLLLSTCGEQYPMVAFVVSRRRMDRVCDGWLDMACTAGRVYGL